MLSDEEKKAIEYLKQNNIVEIQYDNYGLESIHRVGIDEKQTILNLIEKQSKEIEELKKTLKCTQDSWFEDTQKIEEMKKQLDLDNECEIGLNNKIMDLEKEIEELRNEVMEKELIIDGMKEDRRIAVEEIQEQYYVSKDKLKEMLNEYKKALKKVEEAIGVLKSNLLIVADEKHKKEIEKEFTFREEDRISKIAIINLLEDLLKEE